MLFFVVDVMIAVLIFVSTVIVLASFYTPRTSIGGTEQYLDLAYEDFFVQTIQGSEAAVRAQVPYPLNLAGHYENLQYDEVFYLMLSEPDISNATAPSLFVAIAEATPPQFGLSFSIRDLSGATFSRDSASGAEPTLVLSRTKVIIPPSRYCTGACIPRIAEVKIWY